MASGPNNPETTASKAAEATFQMYDDPSGRIHPHEPLWHYAPGGFHPTALGDTFKDGRYVVHRKLGFGGRSTVWLATDEGEQAARRGTSPRGQPSRKNFVSIKIKGASASGSGPDSDPEVIKLRKLESHYLDGPQDRPRTFVRLLDCFVHEGPNGKHNCLVTELLGPALRNVMALYKEMDLVLRPDTILRSSQQLFEAIGFAHQAGLAHGDVSAANVVFTCNALQDDEDEDVMESLSELFVAKAIEPLPSPHFPKELVATSIWDLWADGPAEDIRLIDWGEAFPVDTTVSAKDVAQPLDVRTPETFFVGTLDHKHDLWRAGCVVYNLVYQERLFPIFSDNEHFYVAKMTRKLGPLPDSWMPKFKEIRNANKYADQDEENIEWELITDTFETRRQALISTYENSDDYEKDEHTDYDFESLSQLLQPMQGLLRYEPEARITPAQASAMVEWQDHRREHMDGWQEEDSVGQVDGEDEGHWSDGSP